MVFEELHIPKHREGWVMRYERRSQAHGALHLHRELELNLVIRGSGTYLIQGGRYTIGPGSLLWLFPSQPHLLVEASEDFMMWVVVFRPRLVRRFAESSTRLLEALEAEALEPVQVVRLERSRESVLAQGISHLSAIDPSAGAWFNSGLGYHLMLAWELTRQARVIPAGDRVHPSVEKALHLLREAPETRSLPHLARRVGLSYSRLCALFMEQTGTRLGQYRNQMRLEKLARLMHLHPHRTLLELALEAGFGSYAQCHRCLAGAASLSPRQLRARILAHAAAGSTP